MKVSELKTYKNSLYSALSRDLAEFEKTFVLIASGVLAFSVTFIQEIVKIEEALYLPILFFGWFFMLVSVGLMLSTFLKSANASNELWRTVDKFVLKYNLFKDDDVLSNDQIQEVKTSTNTILDDSKDTLRKMRSWAVGLFVAGLTAFSLFISLNLYQKNRQGKEKPKTETKKNVLDLQIRNDSIIIINQNHESTQEKGH